MTAVDLAHMEETILVAIATATDKIVGAILKTGAEQNANREAMADRIMEQGSAILRTALDDATPRAVDIGPPAANDTDETPHVPGPTTPPEGPANDDAPPPASTPRPSR